MTLFSKRGQSERKKSFITVSLTKLSLIFEKTAFEMRSGSAKLNLKQSDFFPLFEFFGAAFLGGSCHNRFALIGTGPGVHVTGLDIYKCVFAELLEIFAQSRLQLGHINPLLQTLFDFAHRGNASGLVVC